MSAKRAIALGMGVCLFVLGSQMVANAFEQQSAPLDEQALRKAHALKAKCSAAAATAPDCIAGIELSAPDQRGADDAGTEISLPGIGVIGTLPKLDFGLELLYGAPGKSPTTDKPADALPDALMLHGTIKKTF